MTFTYTPSSVNDITRVRYHIGDTVESGALFTDEEITMVITETGTYQTAVISLLQAMIAKYSEPDFRADWLSVNSSKAVASLRTLLSQKRKEFGISGISSNNVYTWRPDSSQTEAPDYDD